MSCSARSLAASDDGGVLIAGTFARDDFRVLEWRDWLLYFDAAGEISWERFIARDGFASLSISSSFTSRETFVVALSPDRSTSSEAGYITVLEVDKRGNMIGERRVAGGDSLWLRGILTTKNGRVMVLGESPVEGSEYRGPFLQILQF